MKFAWRSDPQFYVKLLIDKQTGRQSDKQTDKETEKQTEKQTDKRQIKHNLLGGGNRTRWNHISFFPILKYKKNLFKT